METGGLEGDEYVNQGLSTLTLLYTNPGYYLWQSVFISHPTCYNTSAVAVSFLIVKQAVGMLINVKYLK